MSPSGTAIGTAIGDRRSYQRSDDRYNPTSSGRFGSIGYVISGGGYSALLCGGEENHSETKDDDHKSEEGDLLREL